MTRDPDLMLDLPNLWSALQRGNERVVPNRQGADGRDIQAIVVEVDGQKLALSLLSERIALSNPTSAKLRPEEATIFGKKQKTPDKIATQMQLEQRWSKWTIEGKTLWRMYELTFPGLPNTVLHARIELLLASLFDGSQRAAIDFSFVPSLVDNGRQIAIQLRTRDNKACTQLIPADGALSSDNVTNVRLLDSDGCRACLVVLSACAPILLEIHYHSSISTLIPLHNDSSFLTHYKKFRNIFESHIGINALPAPPKRRWFSKSSS